MNSTLLFSELKLIIKFAFCDINTIYEIFMHFKLYEYGCCFLA